MKSFFSRFRLPLTIAAASLLAVGCTPDYSALQGTALFDEDGTGSSGPIAKAIVIGDEQSPRLSTFLRGQAVDVVDVPFTHFESSDIDIDGDIVVWSDNRNGALDIYGYKISTGEEFAVSTAAGDQIFPQVSGDYVVWEDHRDGNADIYGYQISTKTEFKISTALKNQLSPQIDGDYVVWHDLRGSHSDIYAYRISAPAIGEFAIAQELGDEWYPKISGDYVVWQYYENGFSDIKAYYIPTGTTFDITNSLTSSQFSPEVDGNLVVWVDNSGSADNIRAARLLGAGKNGSDIVVTNAAQQQWNPKVSGSFVTWQSYNGSDFDVLAYNVDSPGVINVAVTTNDQILPAISGNYVVWQDFRDNQYDIWAFDLNAMSSTQITSNSFAQTNAQIDSGNIVWLDQRRGIIDVMITSDFGVNKKFATNTWKTPAGIASELADYDVVIFVNDIISDDVVLELFDTAVAEGKGILGIGGADRSLAQVLARAGRYQITVNAASGCWPMEMVSASPARHALIRRVKTTPYTAFETQNAVTREELAITIDTTQTIDKKDSGGNLLYTELTAAPATVNVWGYFSNYMCNASEPAVVEFTAGTNGARVLLDGTATLADGYEHWEEDRWDYLVNEVVFMKPEEQ